MTAPFQSHQDAAAALLLPVLKGEWSLRHREGQFLGGLAFDANPLSDKQANWLGILLDKHGLPPLAGDDQ